MATYKLFNVSMVRVGDELRHASYTQSAPTVTSIERHAQGAIYRFWLSDGEYKDLDRTANVWLPND